MKIVYIVNLFPRLYNTFTLNDMILLRKKGCDILILAMKNPEEAVVNRDALSLINNVFYFDSFLSHDRYGIIKSIYNLFEKSKLRRFSNRLLVPLVCAKKINGVSTRKYHSDLGLMLGALEGIGRKVKEEGVSVLHGAFGNREATVAMILSEITGIPFTFETHAKDLFVQFRHAEDKVLKARKIFTISNYNKEYLIQHIGCPSEKIVVKRVAYNKKYCDSIPKSARRDNLIISACRLDSIKGLQFAIEAFGAISERWDNLQYIIIGDGPLRGALEEQTKRALLNNKIYFLGNISNEEVLNYISKATIMVLPSVVAPNGDRDGIPTCLIEAMYLKTPVISSKISGIPELVDNGVNGYLTDPGDSQAIAERLNDLLSDKHLRVKMGEDGRRKIMSEFDVEKNVSKLIRTWEEIA